MEKVFMPQPSNVSRVKQSEQCDTLSEQKSGEAYWVSWMNRTEKRGFYFAVSLRACVAFPSSNTMSSAYQLALPHYNLTIISSRVRLQHAPDLYYEKLSCCPSVIARLTKLRDHRVCVHLNVRPVISTLF